VRSYFQNRFDAASDAMRRSMTNPVLNKTSAFTADPHFRHILGQKESTFSLIDAIDAGCFIILALPKNRLGEQTAMIASVLLAKLKNSASSASALLPPINISTSTHRSFALLSLQSALTSAFSFQAMTPTKWPQR